MRTKRWTPNGAQVRTALAAALVGSAVGLLAGLGLARWLDRAGAGDGAADADLDELELEVERRLAGEPALRDERVEVTALAPGIVELWGTARDRDTAARAVAAARAVPGVRVVLNRILTPDVLAPRDDLALRTARGGTRDGSRG